MFFIQKQLSEQPCGRGTEMPAYFFLKDGLFTVGQNHFYKTHPIK